MTTELTEETHTEMESMLPGISNVTRLAATLSNAVLDEKPGECAPLRPNERLYTMGEALHLCIVRNEISWPDRGAPAARSRPGDVPLDRAFTAESVVRATLTTQTAYHTLSALASDIFDPHAALLVRSCEAVGAFAKAAAVNASHVADFGRPNVTDSSARIILMIANLWAHTAALELAHVLSPTIVSQSGELPELAPPDLQAKLAKVSATYATALQAVSVATSRRAPSAMPPPSGHGALAETWRRIENAVPADHAVIGWQAAAGLGLIECGRLLGMGPDHAPPSFTHAYDKLLSAVRPGEQQFQSHVTHEALTALGHDARRYGQSHRFERSAKGKHAKAKRHGQR